MLEAARTSHAASMMSFREEGMEQREATLHRGSITASFCHISGSQVAMFASQAGTACSSQSRSTQHSQPLAPSASPQPPWPTLSLHSQPQAVLS